MKPITTNFFEEKLNESLKDFAGPTLDDESDTNLAKQIFCIRDDLCFVWNAKNSHLLAISIEKTQESTVTTIIPTDTPLFEVEKVTLSCTGRWICLWGNRGATALEIPRRSGKLRKFVGLDKNGNVMAHTLPIAERFFMCNPKIMLQQTAWHPGSTFDGHLITLTTDNQIRIFNLDVVAESTASGSGIQPEETLPLTCDSRQIKRFFGESGLSLKGSLGETAVSFSFAPPVAIDGENTNGPYLWPIFILCGNGSVYCMVTGLGQHRPLKPQVMGPIPMLPQTDDNYGQESCSILCLHPLVSSPPILVIADSKGTLYHCVVLSKTDEDEDVEALETASQISDWSSSIVIGMGSAVQPDLVIHVYESIELELSLLVKEKVDKTVPFDYPLLLHVDPTSPSRYFCSHKAGVHSITLPMVAQLAELVQKPQDTLVATGGFSLMEQNSLVEHILVTQPILSHGTPGPIQGVAISFPPAKLHCILSDFRQVTKALARPAISEPQPLLAASDTLSPRISSQMNKEPFDRHIAQILQRNTNNPIMRAPTDANLSSQECFEILTRSTKVLREEYLDRHEKARREIERRCASLEAKKSQQHMTLVKLTQERFQLRNKAAELSEKHEDLRDTQDNLMLRIEAVLNSIQRRLPVASDSEIRMQRQLQGMERKLKDLVNAHEQIKQKERYQLRQIKYSSPTIKNVQDANEKMGENQIESMRDVLKQDGDQIAKMVKNLQTLKKDLAL